ncbi:MAG TPA: ATP-dependent sacrificial sulfur transferase LarE [Pyrinomonadaceae bacterium]|nr:ATP-dependent sacrificial sulfur transferase LarE [Pyrinomonadaceae bacterium]
MQRKLISNTIKKETSKVSVCFDSDRLAAAAGDKQVRDDPAATAQLKEEQLRELFRRLGSVVVAYSGGVDSSYVAYVANAELGERALCITGESASLAQYQRTEIDRVVREFGLHHEIIQTEELENPGYRANNADRCYFCKDELYTKLESIAKSRAFETIVDGSTTDDVHDYRPGRKAARQHSVRSPLIEVGLSKAEVRTLSKRVALPTWDKPASPCLSSRIAYGTPVTIERLSKIDRGEEILREFGFREFRVRHHDTLVRIEIAPEEMSRVLNKEVIDSLAQQFRELGFKYVTLDLHGFRSGSLNEALVQIQ